MTSRSWMRQPATLAAVLLALAGGLAELLALQAWRLRDRLAGRH